MSYTNRWGMILVCAAAVVSASACANTSGGEDADVNSCQTTYSKIDSPSPGVLRFTGDFRDNESVILGYTDDDGMRYSLPLTPDTDRSTIVFDDLPSGTRTFSITISCDAGQDHRSDEKLTVK